MGQFVNIERYTPANYRGVSAPDADTLYSLAWLDLTEPQVFADPDMGKRFYLCFEMTDLWMAARKPASACPAGGHDALDHRPRLERPGAGRHEADQISDALHGDPRPHLCRRRRARLQNRQCAAGAVQNRSVACLWEAVHLPGTADEPKPDFSMTDAPQTVILGMDTSTYFNMMAKLMGGAAPPAPETAQLSRASAKISLVPGQPFDMAQLNPAVQAALKNLQAALQHIEANKKSLGKMVNGWVITAGLGIYSTNYMKRAVVTAFGWPANRQEDAVYPYTEVDGPGRSCRVPINTR